MPLLEFRAEVYRQETRMMGLSSSEDHMIVAEVVLAWYQRVTDGRMGRSIIANTARYYAAAAGGWRVVTAIGSKLYKAVFRRCLSYCTCYYGQLLYPTSAVSNILSILLTFTVVFDGYGIFPSARIGLTVTFE